MNPELRSALLRGRRRPRNFGAGSATIFRGDGYEFSELRQYVAGDDTRRIDWAATARAGALQTRVVLEDVALTLAAIVDDSGSMKLGRARPMTASAYEAMTSWYLAAAADDRCARITGDGLFAPPGMRGYRSGLVCANAPGGTRPFALLRAFDVARAALPRGTALLVASDFYDLDGQTGDVLRRIGDLGARFDCTALVVRDPWYEKFPLRGFVRLRDAEDGSSQQFFIGPKEQARYRDAVRVRERLLQETLAKAGWRTGALLETNGTHSLLAAFGLA